MSLQITELQDRNKELAASKKTELEDYSKELTLRNHQIEEKNDEIEKLKKQTGEMDLDKVQKHRQELVDA